MDFINPALAGRIGSSTRQRLDNLEFRLDLLWLAEAVRVPFQYDNDPPPLLFGDPGVWTLTLARADGTVLVAGQLLRHGVNVLAPFGGNPLFPGAGRGRLLAWDSSGNANDPGRDDLDPGASVRLIYVPAAEA